MSRILPTRHNRGIGLFGERQKLALIHGCFITTFVLYCGYQLLHWSNISHSIDLISYLDIGDAYWRGDFQNALNTYWSPMYSWILGAVMAVFKPGIDTEMLAVRQTNFVLMMALLASFLVFARKLWHHVLARRLESAPETMDARPWLSQPLYLVFMYSLICFAGLCFGGVEKDTPDVLVASFVLLASTAFLRLKIGDRSLSNFIFMGAMLGFGYLAKAIVLPISLFYYVAAWWEMRKEAGAWKSLVVAAAVELCIAAPFFVAISMACGHPTISDASRTLFLYSNNQNDQQVHFQFPELKHRSSKIFDAPVVYEFSAPIAGTYPPWYNPAYWTEGAPDHDPIGRAFRYLATNSRFFLLEIFSFLLAGWFLASVLLRRSCITPAGVAESWTIAAPAVVACAVYAITANLFGHMMERYFIAWFVLLYSACLLAARFPGTRVGIISSRIFILSMSTLMLVVTAGLLLMHSKMTELYPIPHDTIVANKLRALGLNPGDKIAQLGFRRYYWARLAKVKIVADIFDMDGFWKMDPQEREKLIDVLRRHDVKAIVMTWAAARVKPGENSGWVEVHPTNALVYIIPE